MLTQPRLFGLPQQELTSDDYYTPAWVFERMGIEFDLDVCAPPGGIPWIPAKRHYTQEDDGLVAPWEGRVWMNPPYSDATPWVRRFIDHDDGICLVPHAKSAWHVELWTSCDGAALVKPFAFVGGWPFLPVWFAAFGEECVDAIGRLGAVRRIV
jgi:hypothetical protein